MRVNRSHIRRALIGAGALAALSLGAAPGAAHDGGSLVDISRSVPISVTASDVELCALGECQKLNGGGVLAGTLTVDIEGHSHGSPNVTSLTGSSGVCPTGWQAIGFDVTTAGGFLDILLTFDPVVGDAVSVSRSIEGEPEGHAAALCVK